MSQVIPEGWFVTSLDTIASWGSGGTPSRKNAAYYGGNVPWIKTGDLGDRVVSNASEFITDEAVKNSSAKWFPKGSVVLAMYGATIGKTSILGLDATTNQACGVGHPINGATFTEFLYYFLRNEKDAFIAKGKGGAQPNISQALIKDHEIALPPLAEQKVIADKLDELLAQVESTKARLDAIPAILKSFRQSVLAAAVTGKLIEEFTSISKKISDVASFQNGFAFKSGWFTKSDKWQVIKLGNIRDGHLFIENAPAYVSDDIANDFLKFSPNKGDTLISMTGTRFKKDYGFGCLVGDERDILINQRVGRLIPKRTEIDPKFLNIFIRSDLFRDQFFEGETGGVNQGNVGSNHIMSVRIEVPKLPQQTEIVRRVEELFTFADKVEAQVNAAQARVNNLTQSILAKAFRGELTADWRAANPELISGENSAEALLKRIKAEREALAKAIKGAKKKPVKKVGTNKVTTKKAQDTTINKNLSPVESVIADGIANKPQEIFDKLTPSLSITEVFNEISKLLNDNKIEEKTVDGITGFFIK